MPKAKIHPNQLGFAFDAPQRATAASALAGLESRISEVVGSILNSAAAAGKSRKVIAVEMSELLGDDEVTWQMLDAYASPARNDHKVIMSRFLALVAVCDRHDLLDKIVREIGAAVLVGEEIQTARLGHLDQQIAQLQAERKRVAGQAPLIRGGGQI